LPSLTLNKLKRFETGSLVIKKEHREQSNFSISSGRPAAPSGNFFQYGQNLLLRAPNSDPRTGFKMSISLSTNRRQSTIYAVRVTVRRPKRLQTVGRIEKNT